LDLKHLHRSIVAYFALALITIGIASTPAAAQTTGVHTTYLWHMHQPIYWPDESSWNPGRYETAYETITLGHSQNDVFSIFDSDDRVGDYQDYPRDAISSILDLPEAGAQVSFAGSLKENLFSLGNAGWNGGRYAVNWYADYRTARGWSNSAGKPRLDPVLVGFHHGIGPLMDEAAFRMELACAKVIYDDAWGDSDYSEGFFPAEMCFSERLIPALIDAGIDWSIVGDLHIARACADYPYSANLDNCDPPNQADQMNPAQGTYTNHSIPRGVTLRVPYPYGFTPHKAEYVDPSTGAVSKITVIPAANAMGWDEGYGLFGTGSIDEIAHSNDPDHPMLILFAHDGDNAWSGGYSYYYENVTQFCHNATSSGYTPTTIATYLAEHPVSEEDVVHVEDGGWVNADGDFGSPQFINWNWPLVDSSGQFDIPGGWAEDERNWAVLTAAQNRVETAEQVLGPGSVDVEKVVDPSSGANGAERAWHFLLAGYESGYMYYGAAIDMEVKATLACNKAVAAADAVITGGVDETPPTIWLPQRLPWNPGGFGGGSLWGYPGGQGAPMDSTFHVWTFAYDVSGLTRVELRIREDLDGVNDTATPDNETYAGGTDVGAWQTLPMNHRVFPLDEPWEIPDIDFFVLPEYIADEYWIEVTGYSDLLLDYYIEAEDSNGRIKRSPIQHVYVGEGTGGGIPDETVWWDPEEPVAGESVTIFYDPTGRPLDGAAQVWIHYGFNGWGGVTDSPMTFDAIEEVWNVMLSIPSSANLIDLVFHDNAGTWDNNGGADWHIPVSGASGPSFDMDGQLDEGVPLLASGDGLNLWGTLSGSELYLATEGTGETSGLDRFLFVVDQTGASGSAPWGKAGSVIEWSHFLAAEESNGWSGWFDAVETVVTGPAYANAHGAVLEGVLDLDLLYPGGLPAMLWLAATGYGTAEGGTLAAQAPGGDGNGNLVAAEYYPFELSTSTVLDDAPDTVSSLGLQIHPNPFVDQVTIDLQMPEAGPVDLDVFGPSGRRIHRFRDDRREAGSSTLFWRPAGIEGDRPLLNGVYLFRVRAAGRSAVIKGMLLR